MIRLWNILFLIIILRLNKKSGEGVSPDFCFFVIDIKDNICYNYNVMLIYISEEYFEKSYTVTFRRYYLSDRAGGGR